MTAESVTIDTRPQTQTIPENVLGDVDPFDAALPPSDLDFGDDVSFSDSDQDDSPAPVESSKPKVEPEPEPEPEAEPAPIQIPKARFDEVNTKRKSAEARVKELEAQIAAATREAAAAKKVDAPSLEEIDRMEQEYISQVADGRVAEAAVLRRQIRAAEEARITATIEAKSAAASSNTVAEIAFREEAARLTAQHPVFDPEAEAYDQDVVDETLSVQQALVQTGKFTPASALAQAARYVLGPAASAAKETSPSTAPTPVNVDKKLAVASKQPPSPHATSGRPPAEVIDIKRMSEKDFDQLSEAALAKLRGDTL